MTNEAIIVSLGIISAACFLIAAWLAWLASKRES